MSENKKSWKLRPEVIGTITSSTTIAGSVKITEDLAFMFAAEGRFDLFELPESMILKPIAETLEPVIEDDQVPADLPKDNRPKNKNKNKNKSNNDEAANTQ